MTDRKPTVEELFKRFDWMRDSGICSPTTRALLDDAEAVIEELVAQQSRPPRL